MAGEIRIRHGSKNRLTRDSADREIPRFQVFSDRNETKQSQRAK